MFLLLLLIGYHDSTIEVSKLQRRLLSLEAEREVRMQRDSILTSLSLALCLINVWLILRR
uniref:Mff-like domain-containing protein n=1 Tax=Eptatretus burgeri TaxID=7764 RepID=A0A8C4QQU1_EPTBU